MQDARKSDGLDVSDRISLRWSAADPDLAAALTEHGQLISSEVLAVDYAEQAGAGTQAHAQSDARADADAGTGTDADAGTDAGTDAGADAREHSDPAREHSDPDLGLTFWIRRVPPAPAG